MINKYIKYAIYKHTEFEQNYFNFKEITTQDLLSFSKTKQKMSTEIKMFNVLQIEIL